MSAHAAGFTRGPEFVERIAFYSRIIDARGLLYGLVEKIPEITSHRLERVSRELLR